MNWNVPLKYTNVQGCSKYATTFICKIVKQRQSNNTYKKQITTFMYLIIFV